MPQTTRSHGLIAGALAIVAIIAITVFIYSRRAPAPSTDTASSSPITTTIDGVTVSGGDATVKEIAPGPKAPSYKAPLTFSSSLSADVRLALQKQFDATIAMLDKNALNFDAWVNLGTLRKMTGDYKGAEAILIYVSQIYPKSTVAFDNLGELYLDFIKDYAKAEASFKAAIKNDVHDINAYQQLFSLYTTYGYKAGTSAAADLVDQGLKDNPGNQTLVQFQTQLQAK